MLTSGSAVGVCSRVTNAQLLLLARLPPCAGPRACCCISASLYHPSLYHPSLYYPVAVIPLQYPEASSQAVAPSLGENHGIEQLC